MPQKRRSTVNKVGVWVLENTVRSVPDEAFGTLSRAHYSTAEFNRFERLCDHLETVAGQAFRHWVEVLRWKTENPTICMEFGLATQLGHATYLFDQRLGARFFSPTMRIMIGRQKTISKIAWPLSLSAMCPTPWQSRDMQPSQTLFPAFRATTVCRPQPFRDCR